MICWSTCRAPNSRRCFMIDSLLNFSNTWRAICLFTSLLHERRSRTYWWTWQHYMKSNCDKQPLKQYDVSYIPILLNPNLTCNNDTILKYSFGPSFCYVFPAGSSLENEFLRPVSIEYMVRPMQPFCERLKSRIAMHHIHCFCLTAKCFHSNNILQF